MKRIILVVFVLNFTQSCFGALSAADMFVLKKTYERSPQTRRDYTKLIRTVDGQTKEPLKVTSVQAAEYSEKIDSSRVKCTFPECASPLGKVGKGRTRSGYRYHLETHMNLKYQCVSCESYFKSSSKCYSHIAKCIFAGVPPVKEKSQRSKAKTKKLLYGAIASEPIIESSLINDIRDKRTKHKGMFECLMCSLALNQYVVSSSPEYLECHRATEVHQNVVANFMTGKGEYKELQATHAQLNRELPEDPDWRYKLRMGILNAQKDSDYELNSYNNN